MDSVVKDRIAAGEVEMEQQVCLEFASTGQSENWSGRDFMPVSMSNNEIHLIRAAQHGNVSAFNRLVLAYQDSLYRWALSLVRDEALADDITQIVFITAYEKLSTFRGGSFRAWLFTIARNRSYDELRRHQRRPTFSLDGGTLNDEEPIEIPSTADLQPENLLLASERADAIEQLLNRLPDPFQQVVRLVDLEGMNYQEAASVLRLSLGTVKSRLARARLKMRTLFEEINAS